MSTDLLHALPYAVRTQIESVRVENNQNPYEADPDYDIWVTVRLRNGRVLEWEVKNTWRIVESIVWRAEEGWPD